MKFQSYENNGVKFSSKSLLKIGQTWFIKFEGSSVLSRMMISDLTENTVEFEVTERPYARKTRYKISDLEFVELVSRK